MQLMEGRTGDRLNADRVRRSEFNLNPLRAGLLACCLNKMVDTLGREPISQRIGLGLSLSFVFKRDDRVRLLWKVLAGDRVAPQRPRYRSSQKVTRIFDVLEFRRYTQFAS